jgi:RHS repeat-associated protein
MQPDLALTYSSRNGNSIAGVGWSVSGTGSIYRCPRTLAQDGGNRTVQHDELDQLCYEGQRLVPAPGSAPGTAVTEYRTEVDRFARITLNGVRSSWGSYFLIEHKSGRVSRFEPWTTSIGNVPPDVWLLMRDSDRQGNCVGYNYTNYAFRGTGGDPERVLTSISYTGTSASMSASLCSTGTDARSVEFEYTSDREDKRTTYRFGVASPMTVRLAAIKTKVGGQYVRRYELNYKTSNATRRSLLQSVTLCAGATCGVEKLPSTTLTYQEDAPNFDFSQLQFNGQTLDANWRAALAGDFDGDGRREHVYDYFDPSTKARTRYVDITTCTQSGSPLDPNRGLQFGTPSEALALETSDDIDGDGRADIIGTDSGSGFLKFDSFGSCPTSPAQSPWTNTLLTNLLVSNPAFATTIDYDGDGIIDLRIGSATGTTDTIVRRRTKDMRDWTSTTKVDTFQSPAPPPSMARQLGRDINGDGLMDTVFDTPPNMATQYSTQITFFRGVGQSPPYVTYYLADLTVGRQAPAGAFGDRVNAQRRWIDVNGDGLPDIYEPGTVWINQGGVIGNPNTFRRVTVVMPSNPATGGIDPANNRDRAVQAFAMDIDGDGQDELMIPASRTIDYCGGDPNQTYISPLDAERIPHKAWFCGADFDSSSTPDQWKGSDQSVFNWTAYKFVEQSDGSYALIGMPTNLQAPINTAIGVNPGDWNGDGMGDVRSHLTSGPNGAGYPSLTTAQLGPRVATAQARAPDLLVGVTNGVGATASWVHQPLSRSTTAGAGCDLPTGQSFYVAHQIDPSFPTSQGYVYFTSSMWTVSRFDVSNGIASSTNKTCYRYEDAMLNNEGRGFQGFKVIVAEEQLPPAAGEDATAGYAGCVPGGTCSANNLRTTTEFHQEFPLTSRPKRVRVALAKPGGTSLHETTYWWHAEKSSFGAWVVYSPATLEKKFDLPQGTSSAALLAMQTEMVSEVELISGETARSCAVVNGQTPVPGTTTPLPATARDVIRRDTRTMASDTSIWWLGKVTSREILSDFFTGTLALNEGCLVTGTSAKACAPTPQLCPSVTASTDAKVQTTNYGWYPDTGSSPTGANRKLQSETLVLRSATEAASSYDYDGSGNVTGKHVTGRDISGELLITYTYTSDGYFRSTETKRPTGTVQLVSTVVVDPATGQPTYRKDVEAAPATMTVYDSLGRVLTVRTDGTQPVEQRFSACTTSSNCLLRRQTFQAGAPVKTEYLDRVGRVVATGVEGFDGLEIITKVAYNERGLKVAEYAPWKSSVAPGQWDGSSASPFVTQYSRIDALARIGVKTVVRSSAGLFESGRGEATLTTTYNYIPIDVGLRTDIAVSKPASQGGSLAMSRTYDRRGKLVATTQSTTSTHAIPANYFYDPAGNLRMILDAGSNQLLATYDDVGRKKRVDDPDRGTWTYAWDGIGRLESQTDARGIVISHQYDGIGRLVQRFVKNPTDAAPVLDATWQYDLNSKLGVLGALLGADGFRRDYLYDPLLRPFSVKTTIPGSADWTAQTFTEEYGYDHNYGRVKAMSYPSNEFAALDYDSRGNLLGETAVAADGTRGTVYRHVNALSVRGQVTDQKLGNGVQETADYDESTGMAKFLSASLGEPGPAGCAPAAVAASLIVRQAHYTYDHFLNLARQEKDFHLRDARGAIQFNGCQPVTAAAVETYQYDDLHRLLGASRSWTGMTPGAGTTLGDNYAYDDLGNITSKSDYATGYTYGTSRITGAAGPHAVVSLSTGASFTYDPNGNLTHGDGRDVTFDSLDRPITVTMGGVTTQFRYAPDGARYLQRTAGILTGPYPTKTVYYVDKDYERVAWSSSAVEEKTYIGTSVVIYNRNRSSREVRYLHVDQLGSTDSVTNAGAFELTADAHGMDAFGKPRGRDWQPSPAPGTDKLHPGGDFNVTTERGFTGHEHLDDTYLIHMNGRVYDYRLGRFLSVDPIISNPANSQSINPYSYLGNNPLSGVDPTGYACDDFSTARCDTIWVNPPDAKPNIPKFIKIGDNGAAINTATLNMNAPASSLLAPGNNPDPASASASNPSATPLQLPKGALALSTNEARVLVALGVPALDKCMQDSRCLFFALAGTAAAAAIYHLVASNGDQEHLTATDASGALKPEEPSGHPAPSPETGGAGAMSRGPHDPRQSTSTSSPGSIILTNEGLAHVASRHIVGGAETEGRSIFSTGEDVRALIRAAERIEPVLQRGGNFMRAVDAGRIVGVDVVTGKPTSVYTVITRPSGELVTTFPGQPRLR